MSAQMRSPHPLQCYREGFASNRESRYALFANYQKIVHCEKPSAISKSGFRSFLCSGLQRSTHLKNGQKQKLGSYHQCYRLDGRLVAIGVLDLLPDCVSSVYLMSVFLEYSIL